jgi:hypothetical protein
MRPIPHPSLLALLLALAACTPAPAPSDSQAAAGTPAPARTAPPTVAGPAPATTCPDADFAAFLKRFERSADVQRASTADPLTMESIDGDAQPEPAPVTRQVPLAEVPFPVMTDAYQRQTEGLIETIEEPGADRREVTHAVPDTDAQVRFAFRADPCWKLTRISSDTL